MNFNQFFLCSKCKNASVLFGQNLENLIIVCTPNRTRFSVTMFSYVFSELHGIELSASGVLFFDEIKIFRQMATSIIFYFHRKFWIFKFRLVSVQISNFFVKTKHYKFQTHFFRPSVSPRGSKFRTINWGTSRLPSSDRGVATDSSIMGKIWS